MHSYGSYKLQPVKINYPSVLDSFFRNYANLQTYTNFDIIFLWRQAIILYFNYIPFQNYTPWKGKCKYLNQIDEIKYFHLVISLNKKAFCDKSFVIYINGCVILEEKESFTSFPALLVHFWKGNLLLDVLVVIDLLFQITIPLKIFT